MQKNAKNVFSQKGEISKDIANNATNPVIAGKELVMLVRANGICYGYERETKWNVKITVLVAEIAANVSRIIIFLNVSVTSGMIALYAEKNTKENIAPTP